MRTHVLVPRARVAATRAAAAFGLFRDFDRMLDEFWSGAQATAARTLAPRMDYRETDAEILVSAELPGLEDSDIEVSLEDGVLSIQGERKQQHEEDGPEQGFDHRETHRGRFQRAIRLREEVDQDAVTATYRNGVLTVTLPKSAEPAVRTIPVSAD